VAEQGLSWIGFMRKKMLDAGFADPLPYFQKNFFFTTEPEETNFVSNANLIGWDRLLFATDYPHNDPGGRHRFSDVNLINKFLTENKISQQQFDLLTHQNYLSLARQ
jgi:predicted TIM-barrel fold metal-dependent hydrolase